MPDAPATADRSLEHWSEARRAEMEAFYLLATQDYRELEAAHDWGAELRSRAVDGRVRLLDVACGSGKFPTALLAGGLADTTVGMRVEVDLLDPSAFSVAEARGVLAPPFVAAAELVIGLEALDVTASEPYDVAWATHALYAVPPVLLADGLARMHAVLRPGGLGVVAQASSRSHYLACYDAYRADHAPDVAPFTTAEQVIDGLRAAGADVAVATITYRTGTTERSVAEGFLQRCLFDDAITLDAMAAPGAHGDRLATYLAGCVGPDGWWFDHEVRLITWERAAQG